MSGATKKLPRFFGPRKLLFLQAVLAQSVQSIMGGTEMRRSKSFINRRSALISEHGRVFQHLTQSA